MSTSTSQLLRHTSEYMRSDPQAHDRPRGKELVSEGSRWLRGLRSTKTKGVPIESTSPTSHWPPPSHATPWPEPVPAEDEGAWLGYTGRYRADSGASTTVPPRRAETGYAASIASTVTDSKDPLDAAWTEWNEEEALRQALEASRLAFEGVPTHQGVPDRRSSAEEDADIQRAIRESAVLAEAEVRRQREAEREEAELQRVLRETSVASKGKQPARRRSTTAEEKEEVRQALELSLREQDPSGAGPSSALEASQGTESAVASEPSLALPPLPPTYDVATSSGPSQPSAVSRSPPRAGPPPLPERRAPSPPRGRTGSPERPFDGLVARSHPTVDAPGPVPGAPAQPHRAPPLPPKEVSPAQSPPAMVDSPSSDVDRGTGRSPDERNTTSYFAPAARPPGNRQASLSPPGMPRRPSLSPSGSERTLRRGSADSFPDDEAESFISGFGNVPFDPTGEYLPNGGYRTRSPAQLSRLTERTEPGYPTSPSINESNMALEAADQEHGESATSHAPSVTTTARPGMPRPETGASSVYVDAQSTSSDPAVTAEANKLTPPESPFGEAVRFGYECDDQVHAIDFPPGLPEVIEFSNEVGEDTFRRPRGAFAIEAPTYSTLLRGLMWYGNTRLAAAGEATARSEVGLAATFIGGTPTRAPHVRLTIRILPTVAGDAAPESSSTSVGRLRLPLPDRVLLPSSLSEVAVSLYTLRHLAAIACSTQPGNQPTASYRSLRQLGHAIERLASEHGEGKKPAAEEGKMLRRLKLRLLRGGSAKGKEPAL